MIPFTRFILVLAVALTVVYVSLWFYFRAGARERLQQEWAREQPPLPEHTHVDVGMRAYETDLRRKLITWVYAVPLAVVILSILVLNSA